MLIKGDVSEFDFKVSYNKDRDDVIGSQDLINN